jgi:hypothetical protein
MTDLWAERLSEFLDGELSPPETAELERHLLECSECRRALSQLRAVVARLSGDVAGHADQPTHQSWNRIEHAIAPRRGRWIWGAAIAASLAVVAIGVSLRRGQPPAAEPPRFPGFPADYRAAAMDLETILRDQQDRLRPETVRAVEASLTTIDSAIAQAARALAADPANEFITRYLAQLRDTRMTALRDAVALVRGGG